MYSIDSVMKRNNRKEVVKQILEWLKAEGVAYRPKENDSSSFRATINLSQNLNLDIQLSRHRPDRLILSTNAYLAPDDQRA